MRGSRSLAFAATLLLGCQSEAQPKNTTPAETVPPSGGAAPRRVPGPPTLAVEILRELPHSSRAYTQGLMMLEGRVYESRGQYGRSGIDIWDPETGETFATHELASDLFGEGLTRVGDTLWQLTWQSGIAIRYDLDLNEIERAQFPGEGWGLEFDGERLIMSDGTNLLRFFDPESFEPRGELRVRRGARGQADLNELELIAESNEILANVYQSQEIVRIDLTDGQVTAVYQVPQLLSRNEARRADVLNGIARWSDRDSYLITGKHWPKSFEVRFESP